MQKKVSGTLINTPKTTTATRKGEKRVGTLLKFS